MNKYILYVCCKDSVVNCKNVFIVVLGEGDWVWRGYNVEVKVKKELVS